MAQLIFQEFMGKEQQAFFKSRGIYFNPQTTSRSKAVYSEMAMRMIKRRLFLYLTPRLSNDWPSALKYMTKKLNERPSERLGRLAPVTVQFGPALNEPQIRTILTNAKRDLKPEPSVETMFANQREYENKKNSFHVGDLCMIPSKKNVLSKAHETQVRRCSSIGFFFVPLLSSLTIFERS